MEACLPHCQRFEVNDAHAYLLERLGDIAAAIKLYVRDIERCNAALIHAVLQGDMQLPNVTTASGRFEPSWPLHRLALSCCMWSQKILELICSDLILLFPLLVVQHEAVAVAHYFTFVISR